MAEEYTYSRTRYERELFINRREFLWTSLPWKSEEIMKKAKRMSLQWSRLISTLTARLLRKDEERRRRRRRILWWIKLNSFAICPMKVFELQPLWVSSLIHIASQKSYIPHFQLARIPRLSSAHWSHWSDLNLLLKVWLDLNESLLDGFYDLLCRVQFRTESISGLKAEKRIFLIIKTLKIGSFRRRKLRMIESRRRSKTNKFK